MGGLEVCTCTGQAPDVTVPGLQTIADQRTQKTAVDGGGECPPVEVAKPHLQNTPGNAEKQGRA